MGLLARHIEESGIPTVSMTSALDITRMVKPPRSVFVNFPMGYEAGPPNNPALQRRIMLAALNFVSIVTEPGSILELPLIWEQDPEWEIKL